MTLEEEAGCVTLGLKEEYWALDPESEGEEGTGS